jgi:epoxyqueuosine reductase
LEGATYNNSMSALAERLKQQARTLGFDLAGIAAAVMAPGAASLRAWLEKGCAGEMSYMERHAAAREHPRGVLEDVRSVLMVAMNYQTRTVALPERRQQQPDGRPHGRIASYAWGCDYHDVLWDRLDRLLTWVQAEVPGCKGRAVVDTAPLLERDFARLAGLGWFGKNTMLIHKRLGSFFFLGALLLDIELPADEPFTADHCGTCTACLDACPTQAFPAPYELDARRCISYLTIELRKPIPPALRSGMGNWIFGCDICQDVCPWNRKAPLSAEPAFQPRDKLEAPDLIELLRLTPAEFRERFRGTALTRPKRGGFLRNVAIALGNTCDVRAVPVLIEALHDGDALVRGAAAWALGQIGGDEALVALRQRAGVETDTDVVAELTTALAGRSEALKV